MKKPVFFVLMVFACTRLHAGLFNTNLTVNGNAEAGLGSTTGNDVEPVPGWTTANNFTVTLYGTTSDIPTNCPGPSDRGANLFTGGPNTAVSSAYQLIDIASAAGQVDAGAVQAQLTGYLGGWQGQDDNAVLKAEFMDGVTTNILGTISVGPVLALDRTNLTALLFRGATNAVPAGTRQVKVTLTMTRIAGNFNDGYADNLSLVLLNQPTLSIQSGTSRTVSWPAGIGAWLLQSATNLAATPTWTDVAPPYQTNASQIQFTDSSPTGSRFFRLRLP